MTNIRVTVNQPGGVLVTTGSGQRSTVQSAPNTNPTVVTLDDNNPSLRLGSLVSNTGCTALTTANQALAVANTANTEAQLAYTTANLAYVLANNANNLAQTVYTLISEGGGDSSNGVVEVITGLGLSGGVITDIGVISANIASETTQGVTKLIDSVFSYDTGNAATANAVTMAYTLAAYANAIAANTITQNAQLLMANVVSSNTIELNGVEQSSTTLTTTANGTQVVIDMSPASEFSTFKYLIQAKSVDSIHSLELLSVQDGVNTYSTQYGSVYTVEPLGDFEINLSGSTVVLYMTPTNPLFHMITIRVLRQSIIS